MKLDRRRRFAYGYLALMVLASIAEVVWRFGLGRPPVYDLLNWLPLLTVFPIISVIAVARETAALKAGRPLSSPRANVWLLVSALGAFVLLLALGLMLAHISRTR